MPAEASGSVDPCTSLVKMEEAADDPGCESKGESKVGPASTISPMETGGEGGTTLQAVSPVFPGFSRPTIEDCRALDMELAAIHGVKEQPPPSGTCMEQCL